MFNNEGVLKPQGCGSLGPYVNIVYLSSSFGVLRKTYTVPSVGNLTLSMVSNRKGHPDPGTKGLFSFLCAP